MEIRRKLTERVREELDLPGEPVPGSPILEVLGEDRLLIENHRGILHYSGDKILVKLSYGTAVIQGTGLEISRMTFRRLIISGALSGITLLKEGKHEPL